MDKRELTKLVRAAGRMLLALGFVFSQTAWAAQSYSTKESSRAASKSAAEPATVKTIPSATAKTDTEETENAAKQNAAEETVRRDGRREGIKVHGHWTIEIHNPDGTLADRREFENSLSQSTGAQILAGLLNNTGAINNTAFGSTVLPFWWAVTLAGPQSLAINVPAGPCGTGNPCVIAQNFNAPGPAPAPGFLAGFPDSFALTTTLNGGTFTLGGSVAATTTSNIVSVATSTVIFPPASLSNLTPAPIYTQFTSTTLPNPITATAGQTVAVTVIISFS